MVSDINYWSKVIKRLILLALTIILMFICFKLSVFYMPFLVSFVLALLLEPVIKLLMKKFKWTRRISSIFVIVLAILAIVSILVWGIITLFSEANNLIENSEVYYNNAKGLVEKFTSNVNILGRMPEDLKATIETIENNLVNNAKESLTNILNGFTNWVKSVPDIILAIFFSVMSLYFVCTDKIYMIDQLEHHLPELWMKKLTKHLREIAKALGEYLRAEATLIFVSFIISLIGLTIYDFMGLNIEFPLLVALGIGFVDALPILRFWNCNGSMGHYKFT